MKDIAFLNGSNVASIYWSSIEGATYSVHVNDDLMTTNWQVLNTSVTNQRILTTFNDTLISSNGVPRFYRVQLESVETFEGTGSPDISPNTGVAGTTVVGIQITISQMPPPPFVPVSSVLFGGIAGTNISWDGNIVTVTFTIPGGEPPLELKTFKSFFQDLLVSLMSYMILRMGLL
ncbi:MAG: hypothetical protein GKR87_02535 [Kiritimatiellae bacterium]|nr:hypothetical protein [Kiritimatiellia bacterium]